MIIAGQTRLIKVKSKNLELADHYFCIIMKQRGSKYGWMVALMIKLLYIEDEKHLGTIPWLQGSVGVTICQ